MSDGQSYRIYTRPNMVSGAPYVVLEVDGKFIREKYCMTMLGAKWVAYWWNLGIKSGKDSLDNNLYKGTIK